MISENEYKKLINELQDKIVDLSYHNEIFKYKANSLDLLISDILNSLIENEKQIKENKRFNLDENLDNTESLNNLKNYIQNYLKNSNIKLINV